MRVRALKEFRYNGETRVVDAEFDMDEKSAFLLGRLQKIEEVTPENSAARVSSKKNMTTSKQKEPPATAPKPTAKPAVTPATPTTPPAVTGSTPPDKSEKAEDQSHAVSATSTESVSPAVNPGAGTYQTRDLNADRR